MSADNPLKTAIEEGNASSIDELLGRDPTLINKEFQWTDRKGRRRSITPIRYANACDQQASIDALLASGATLDFMRHSLSHCVGNRDMAQVKRLLALGVRPNPGLISGLDSTGQWRYQFVNVLIDAGADYEDGPYMDIHRGDLSSLERRIQRDGALVNRTYEDTAHAIPTTGTLLHVAAAHNDSEFVELLLRCGADIDAIGPIHETNCGRRTQIIFDGTGGQTPIFHTIGRAFGCCYEAFDILLRHGPDLSIRARCYVEGEIKDVTPLEPPKPGIVRHRPLTYDEATSNQSRVALLQIRAYVVDHDKSNAHPRADQHQSRRHVASP